MKRGLVYQLRQIKEITKFWTGELTVSKTKLENLLQGLAGVALAIISDMDIRINLSMPF